MKIRPTKTIASIALAAFITSNSLFVYAGDATVTSNTYEISANNDGKSKAVVKVNKINDDNYNGVSVEVRSPYVFESGNFENDNSDVLNLLNSTYDEYREQLQRGESLINMLHKRNSMNAYNMIKYMEYETILNNAVANNALSTNERSNLLSDYIAVLV